MEKFEKFGVDFHKNTREFDDFQIFLFKIQNSIISNIRSISVIFSGKVFIVFKEKKFYPPIYIQINSSNSYNLSQIKKYFGYYPIFRFNIDEKLYNLKINFTLQHIQSSKYDDIINSSINELSPLNIKYNKIEVSREYLEELIEKLGYFSIDYLLIDDNTVLIEKYKLIFSVNSIFSLDSKYLNNYTIAKPLIKKLYTVKTQDNQHSEPYLSLGYIISKNGNMTKFPEFNLVFYNNKTNEFDF